MLIEILTEKADRMLVTVEAAELSGYGVSFPDMSLGDPSTRALLRDLLEMADSMGLRREGERVRVDCARTEEGGCALLISRVPAAGYRFATSDDLIDAHLAGVLPEGRLERSGAGWRLVPDSAPDAARHRLLGEFCDGVPEE